MADDKADAVKDDKSQAPVAEPAPAKDEGKALPPKEPEAPKEADPIDWEEDEEKPKAEPKTEPKKEEPKTETEDEAEAEVEETETEEKPPEVEKPQGKAEERKTQLNTEIRDLVAQRNALKADVEKANAEVYQPATEEELTDQGLSATDAKVEALRQQIEMRDYNEKVAEAQLTIGHESERVLNDFPIFNSESESYDKELAEEAATLLQQNLITDPNSGQIIGSNVSPYQLYKTLARASGISATKGEIKGQRNTEKQLANVDAPSSAAPEKKPVDPIMESLQNWDEP